MVVVSFAWMWNVIFEVDKKDAISMFKTWPLNSYDQFLYYSPLTSGKFESKEFH